MTTTNEESAEALASFVQYVFVHEDIQVVPDKKLYSRIE